MAEPGLLAELRLMFPWMDQIGLSPAWFQTAAATAASSEELVQQIRGTEQWRSRFPGIYRGDGTMRGTEADYMRTEADYRNVLRQFGYDVDQNYKTPVTLVGFFEGEQAPDELRDRLTVYRHLGASGRPTREAFYVYAGMEISTDDLFEAAVDPAAEQRLYSEYNQRAAALSPDYQGWITRATQMGLSRSVDALRRMQSLGATTGQVVQRLQSTDPNFAREIMHALYTGGGNVGGAAGTLPLQDLLESFEFATIGAAATSAGLELPTKERLAEIRATGVERAKQIQSYTEFGRNKEIFSAAVKRARGTNFGQTQFEGATFLGNAEDARALEAGVNYIEASGKQQGSFRFAEDNGRIIQRGFSNR